MTGGPSELMRPANREQREQALVLVFVLLDCARDTDILNSRASLNVFLLLMCTVT
jgi:hypothetical protein